MPNAKLFTYLPQAVQIQKQEIKRETEPRTSFSNYQYLFSKLGE